MVMLRILTATLAATALPIVAAGPAGGPLPAPLQALPAPPELVALDRPVAPAIAAFVRKVNPRVTAPRAVALTGAILEASERRGLDPLLLAGIIAQESHFRAGVQSCVGRGCDLGVAQVNWEVWGAELDLDRQRLIHDDDYNVGVAADILADLHRRYGDEAGRWWTRYHDRRPERRAQYASLVRAHEPALLGRL